MSKPRAARDRAVGAAGDFDLQDLERAVRCPHLIALEAKESRRVRAPDGTSVSQQKKRREVCPLAAI